MLSKKLNFSPSPAQIVIFSICALSCFGALLLMLPVSNTSGQFLNPLHAFFMAISATCVTGLVVLDVGKDLTTFGQMVILLLIQIGGLGYMTLTTILVYIVGKKLSLRDTKIFNLATSADQQINLKDFAIKIGFFTLLFESVGAIFLLKDSIEIEKYSFGDSSTAVLSGVYHAIFHSVSAFCNAGFSLYSTSLENHSSNYWFLFVFSALTILGGLGYTVLHEIFEYLKKSKTYKFSLHSKICIKSTIALLVLGCVIQLSLIYLLDLTYFVNHGLDQIGKIGEFFHNFWVAFFQTCAARTAGFNSVPLNELGEPSLFFLITWMFIGACPGSTAGGIKITTFVVILSIIYSAVKNKKEIVLDNRSISQLQQNKAIVVFCSASILIIAFTMLMCIFEESKGFTLLEQLFEVSSAFNTVGLSTGITMDLSDPSLVVLCLCMLIGRPGTLLFLMALIREEDGKAPRYPEEGILIG